MDPFGIPMLDTDVTVTDDFTTNLVTIDALDLADADPSRVVMTVNVESPIPMFGPKRPATQSPGRPQPTPAPRVPDTIDGYAAAFARQIAGPGPLPQPSPARTFQGPDGSTPQAAANAIDKTPHEDGGRGATQTDNTQTFTIDPDK